MTAEVLSKAMDRRPDIPVVYMTGYAEPLGVAEERNAVILRKPFRSSDLLRAVETTVKRQEQRLAVSNIAPMRPASSAGAA
jgi:FixJ family two-component response regulator